MSSTKKGGVNPGKNAGAGKAKGGSAPVKKTAKAPRADASEDVKRDQKLQAILMADSFTVTFRPITLECPKVLLPLVNVPMLDYTIEFLTQNGVLEIFVFCVWHADLIQTYINSSKWPALISIKCISSPGCLTAGDALRELDTMNIIRSDPFILISGDVISNINLAKAIAFHKQKCKEDSNNVMTVVLKKAQYSAGARPLLDDLVVGIDGDTSQILLFDNNVTKKSVSLPLALINDHKRTTFHRDLLDCHIDICSPELMVQFSDNFDYQDVRKDFIENEVGNHALGKHIFSYIIQDEYAARVRDARTYHAICRDIVLRWVYPFVPDSQLLQDNAYTHTKRYTYKGTGNSVARSATIEEGVVLGHGSTVGHGANVSRSIIGQDCTIGDNCSVSESHVWKDVVIESGARIEQSILCDGVIVRRNAVVSRGCVLSYGVIVGEGVVLPEYSRVSVRQTSNSHSNSSFLGHGGVGFLWVSPSPADADDDEASVSSQFAVDRVKAQSIGCWEEESWKHRLWDVMPPPADDFDEEDEDGYGSGSNDEGGYAMRGENSPNGANAANINFTRIISEMVLTGYAEGHPAESLLMEIKGCKFAQNKTYSDCLAGIIPALLAICAEHSLKDGAIKTTLFVSKLKELCNPDDGWGEIMFDAMIQDTRDEVSSIMSIERCVLRAEHRDTLYPIFRFVLQILYESDIFTEEGILRWIDLREGNSDAAMFLEYEDPEHDALAEQLFQEPQVQAFVEWIKADSEEDDDDEDDDDEEEEEEED